ncbi:MAG: C45 family autoproteolytic acyltransferase/hydrolase [bacterium]
MNRLFKRTFTVFVLVLCGSGVLASEDGADVELRVEGDRVYFGEAYREEREGFIVVHLKGEPYSVGYQQGVLLKDEIRYALKFMDKVLLDYISEYGDMKPGKSTLAMLKDMAYNSYISKEIPFILEEHVREMEGVADGAGVKYKDILTINAGYDAIENLMKLYCSAFAAGPPATKDGKLFHGRNLDWEPPELVAEQNIIFFIEPEGGVPFAHVAPSHFTDVLTGMNMEGIAATIDVSLSSEPKIEGMPTFLMLRQVMQSATSLEEAIRIIESTPRTVGNNFVISDGKALDAVVLECSSSRCETRKLEDGLVWATNHYEHPEMKKVQASMKSYWWSDTGGRYGRLGELLRGNSGSLDIDALVGIFRDRYNWETATHDSFCPHSLCSPKNSQSVIFEPAEKRFWVAQPLPIPSCDGKFVPFDLRAEFGGEALPAEPIEANPHRSTPDYKAFEHFHRGIELMKDDAESAAGEFAAAAELAPDSVSLHRLLGEYYCNDLGRYAAALGHLERALELAEGRATEFFPMFTVWYFVGKVRLGNGEPQKAIEALRKALEFPADEDQRAWAHVRIGQANDAAGNREAAVEAYGAAAEKGVKSAGAAARKYLDNPFDPGKDQLENGRKQSYLENPY